MTETETDSHDPGIEKKTRLAATEEMRITQIARDLYEVENKKEDEENSLYSVDLEDPAVCLCKSCEYQPGPCKHIRRVRMEIGDRPVPGLPENEITVGEDFEPLDAGDEVVA